MLGFLVLTAAIAATPQSGSNNAASEPQGPQTSTPLQRQSGTTVQTSGGGSPTAAPAPAATIDPLPNAGQPSAGVMSYSAAFFTTAQPNTARDMIDRVPGFTFDDGSSVRGFEGAAGNVLIDGELPTSKGDDIGSVLRRIPASQVLRIDLIRGGAPGVDMHGKVLIANVIRRSGSSSTALVAVSNQWMTNDGRQAPAIRLEGTRRRDGTSLEGSLVVARFFDDSAGDGTLVQTGPGGALQGQARDNTKAGGYEVVGTGAYSQPFLGGRFRINASFETQPYANNEIVGDQAAPTISPSVEHDHQNIEQAELGLHYSRDFGPKLSLETLALQQLNGEDSLTLLDSDGELDRFREQHTNGETIGRGVLTWRPQPVLTFEGGAEIAYNWLDSHTNYTTNNTPVAVPAADVTVTELRGEAFAKGTWTPSPKLSVEFGVRMEVSHIASSGDVVLQKTLEYPKPRLALAWSPTTNDQLRLRLEREVGQLDFNDFVAASSLSTGQILAGNPNLTPQQAWVIEGGYERRFLKDGAATLTLRHSALTDVIDRAPVIAASGDFDAPANIGGGSKDELVGDLSFPLKALGVTGGLLKTDLTWRRSQVRDPTTGEERPISGLKPFEGTVEFSQDLPQWKMKWGGELNVGYRQRYYRYDQIETDAFSPFGEVYLEVRPQPGWTVRVEARDIGISYDRKLANWADLRGPGLVYEDLADRNLGLGPIGYLRVRRNW